jgi:hypothetical protein
MASAAEERSVSLLMSRFARAGRLNAQTILTLLYVVFCAISVLPFLVVDHPPIVDFANHAARLWIACHQTDPAVAAMYDYRLGIIPNLAVDILNLPLCGIASPTAVLKLLTVSSLVLIYISAAMIQRKMFGRLNAFILAVPAVSLNLITTMGYINYLAGVALVIALVAITLNNNRRFLDKVIICNVFGIVIFFCHIFALSLAIVLFFGFNLSSAERSFRGIVRSALKTAALFAIPLCLIPLVAQGGEALNISYEGKLRVLPAMTLTQHAGLGIYGLLPLLGVGWFRTIGRVELSSQLRFPLGALAIYVATVPSELQGAVDIDSRSMVALGYLFFAGLRPLKAERRVTKVVGAIAACMTAISLTLSGKVWSDFDRQVVELRSAFEVLPPRAAVFSVNNAQGHERVVQPMAYSHLTSYATIDRRIFNPLEFSGIGMQPLQPTAAYQSIDTAAASPISASLARVLYNPSHELSQRALRMNLGYLLRWPEKFDYVVYYHFGTAPNFAPERLTLIAQGSYFSILRIRRGVSNNFD